MPSQLTHLPLTRSLLASLPGCVPRRVGGAGYGVVDEGFTSLMLSVWPATS